MSVLDLAEAADISPFHIRTIESGGGNPHANTLGAIAEALGCAVDDLFVLNRRYRRGRR